MASTDTFGHFLLPLTMNKGHIDVHLADCIFAVRHQYLELKLDRPERHAIRNLLGMLSFRLGRFEQALEYLDKVLSPEEDPENLNALANRKYMCEKLFMFPEARHCQEVLTRLLAQDGTKNCENRCQQLRARSLAEHAFAYSYELFEESVTVERYRKTVALYEEAKTLACDMIDNDEKEDWLGVNGMACHKIYRSSKSGLSCDEEKMWFQKAVKSFMLIALYSEDCSLLSESWRHLGELFEKSQRNINLLPSIPEQLKEYVSQPVKCFEKALSISPRDPRILARYAAHHQRERNYSEALSKVHTSIEVDGTVFNTHAFYVRASILMAQYRNQRRKAAKISFRGTPDVNLLEAAEKDLKRALQLSPTPWYFQLMAEIFYFKATDSNGSMKHGSQGKKNLQLALTYCAKAVGCQDGQKTGGIHKLRGDCLCAMDEHHAALECFKRAVECEHAVQFYGASIHSLVAEYEHVCKATATIPADDSSFVADMVYWLHMVANICLSIKWTLRSLQELKQLSNHWKNIVKYCNDNNYQAALETIELAAIDADKRQPHIFRQYLVPAPGEGFVPVTSTRRLQSSPRPGTTETAARTSTDYTPAPTATDICHAEVCGTSTEVAATSTHQTPAENIKDKTAVETVTTSLAAIALHETANSASDTIQITYSVNLKTGKTRHVSTLPPTQENTTDHVPKKHVRSAPERPFNRLEFKYDFFVIYSDSASEWVQHRMLQELEETRLKGCIKDRDFLPGKPNLENYADSITDSACTVIVITKDFETDQHCVRAMLIALELDRLVIPVVHEERDMPTVLKPLPRLDATGAVDWASLQRSIEQQVRLEKSK